MTHYTRLLGFDFGKKKIGVAFGQTITNTAKALCKLSAVNGVPHWEEIQKLINTWRPEALIVGLPLNMNGTEQPISEAATQFKEALKKKFSLPIFMQDERLTTVEARALIFEQGGYKALQEENIDALAAVLILESWMRDHAN